MLSICFTGQDSLTSKSICFSTCSRWDGISSAISEICFKIGSNNLQNDPAIAPLIIEEEEIIHRIPQNPNTSFASGRQSAVSARRSAHARRQSVLDGSAFFEDERPDELRPKSGREGRKLRSARVQAEIRAEDQVLDSEFYG